MKNKNKKKILIIGSKEKFSLENMYLRALKSCGHKVNFIHTYNINKNFFYRFLWKFFKSYIYIIFRHKIINYFYYNKKKYDLIIIFKGLYLNKIFFSKLKKFQKNAKWINIFPDDPFNTNKFEDISNQNFLESIKLFDFFFIFSQKILKKLKTKYPSRNIEYLPFGYDHFRHKIYYKFKKKKYDLSFVGTADQKRYKFLKKLKEFKIILAGNGWDKFQLTNNVTYLGNVDAKEFSNMVNNSIVSLNILRDQNENSHNMKTFEIPAFGGVLLTKRSHEQNLFFPENTGSLMYGNIAELKKKIYFAKNNNKKISKIKKRSKNIIQKHSYKNRSLFILKNIFND